MKPLAWFVAFSVVLIRIPTILGRTESPLPWILALSPFWLYTAWRIAIRPWRAGRELGWRVKPTRAVLLAVFVGLLVVAFVRAGLGGAYSMAEAGGHTLLWGTISAFGAAIFWAEDLPGQTESVTRKALLGLALSLPIYVTLNVGLHFAGIDSPKTIYGEPLDLTARIFAMLGISASRTLFPMAAGIAAFGMVAGGAFVCSAGLLLKTSHSRARRAAYLIGLVASGYAILATDTRAAVMFVIVSMAAILLVPRITAKYAWGLPALSPLFPVALVFAISVLSGALSGADLRRSGEDLSTLNNRTNVWRPALRDLPSHGVVKLAVGHGYEGHYLSGVSQEYADWFSAYKQPEFRGLHNVYLQYLYDLGLIGVSLYLALAILLMKALSGWVSSGEPDLVWPLLAVGVYLIFAGSIDRIPTPYSQELFLVFLMLVIYATSAPDTSEDAGRGRSHLMPGSETEVSQGSAGG